MSSRFNSKFNSKFILAGVATVAVLYVILLPLNKPLYDLLLFPLPDRRTPDLKNEFAMLRKSSVTKTDAIFKSRNGRKVYGWFLEKPGTRRVFLYSHGKGVDIYGNLNVAEILLSCDGSVLTYDYQGFGKSEGRPSVEASCEDGIAAYDYLIEHEHRKPSDIIAFGESFGSGVTSNLVKNREVGGVIIQSGFSSLIRAGREKFVWLWLYPRQCFPAQVMDNMAVFAGPHPPLLIVHGTSDSNVSYKNAVDLFNAAIPPRKLVTISGGGHGAFGTLDQFRSQVATFLRQNKI